MSLLQTKALSLNFGGIQAVDRVDFSLEAGEVHALIGPNGAGKTSFVSLLAGRRLPVSGQILLAGRDITKLPAHARVQAGIAYTFQITSIFPGLTVFDNVALALQGGRMALGPGADALSHAVAEALDRTGLGDLASDIAGNLSYGHQRLLEVTMGLALQPKILILDEPTQGLAAGEIDGFKALIRSLTPTITVLLIEHNMEVVMEVADRITVLNFGKVLASGSPAQIRGNRAVQEAYLGA